MQLYDLVIKWGRDRGIQQNATPDAQWLKTISELGELADAVNKRDLDGIKDGVGDVLVTLILFGDMYRHQRLSRELRGWVDHGESIADEHAGRYIDRRSAADLVGQLATSIVYVGRRTPARSPGFDARQHQMYWHKIGRDLVALSIKHGLTLRQCLQSAYDEIKDRQGVLTKEGVFIKSTDPLYPAALAALQTTESPTP